MRRSKLLVPAAVAIVTAMTMPATSQVRADPTPAPPPAPAPTLGLGADVGSIPAPEPRRVEIAPVERRLYMVTESVGLGARAAMPVAFGPEWQVVVDGTPALFVEQLESKHVRPRMATDPWVFGDVAVVAGGHNYPYWDPARFDRSVDSMIETLRAAGVKRIYWVMLREVKPQYVTPSAWRQVQPYYWYFPTVNDHLEAALSRHPDLFLVDWTSAADRSDITYDAIHLNAVGARVYSELVRDTVLATEREPARNSVTEVEVSGVGGVPADAAAVAVNLTVANPRATGFLTAFPCGVPQPLASNSNFVHNQVVAAAAIVPVGADGSICIGNSERTNVIVDVTGAFPTGSGFEPVTPVRLADTREPDGSSRNPALQRLVVDLDGVDGVAPDARAVALSVTATDAAAEGFVSVGPCDQPLGTTSNVNVGAGATAPNLVITRPAVNGTVCVISNVDTHLIVDLLGSFAGDADMDVVDAARLLDTREIPGGRPEGGSVTTVHVTGADGVPTDATGVVLNLTSADPGANGFLTAYPCDAGRPTASNLNIRPGTNRANLVIVAPDGDGDVCVFSSASTDVIVDLFGWLGGSFVGITPTRLVDTRE
jgi:hypothetical protein